MNIAGMIDHTLLKPDASRTQIEQLCEEGIKYHFASVCMNPVWVKLCKELLGGSTVKICSVSGFPLGASKPEIKAQEAELGIGDGADEIDMVMNVGAFKTGDLKLVEEDIRAVRSSMGRGKILKVIIEAGLLTDEEKIRATEIVKSCEADFVKTNTGFGYGGATIEDVRLLRKIAGNSMGVKASGGIRDYLTARSLIEAGANRIGTSSGVKIMQEYRERISEFRE
ncbi:MAG: deoxyribose-phosphate aldolase [Candidatus Zixiibacteriota bacterium]